MTPGAPPSELSWVLLVRKTATIFLDAPPPTNSTTPTPGQEPCTELDPVEQSSLVNQVKLDHH